MAGELWRQYWQIGKETTPNTTVAATRKMYFNIDDSKLMRERDPRPKKFATQSRDNVRAMTLGPIKAGGSIALPLSASEIIELLLMGINGGVTPTGTAAYLWAFTPGTTLDPATMEWYDGARGWEMGGTYVDKIKIAGSVTDETIVTADLFGMSLETATMTAALTDRTPDFIEGWETKMYLDALGDTPGTTQVTGTLINWDIEIANNTKRKYFAENTQDAGAIIIDALDITGKLTFEASNAAAATAFADWDAVTEKLLRLDFGNNEVISGADTKFVTVDLPGAWDALDLGGTDEGTRVYELSLQYIYDPTNAFGLQIRAQNARSAAWV